MSPDQHLNEDINVEVDFIICKKLFYSRSGCDLVENTYSLFSVHTSEGFDIFVLLCDRFLLIKDLKVRCHHIRFATIENRGDVKQPLVEIGIKFLRRVIFRKFLKNSMMVFCILFVFIDFNHIRTT